LDEFNQLVGSEPALLFYFSTDECQVCKVLKPKVNEMLGQHFPKMKLFYVNSNQSPEIAAQNRIFVVPTILVFFDKREFLRKSRSFGLDELKSEISRPYHLMFS
jgi:thioredoxin-like negative regulator of GroEL